MWQPCRKSLFMMDYFGGGMDAPVTGQSCGNLFFNQLTDCYVQDTLASLMDNELARPIPVLKDSVGHVNPQKEPVYMWPVEEKEFVTNWKINDGTKGILCPTMILLEIQMH